MSKSNAVSELVKIELLNDGVAILTISRPEKLNALNAELVSTLKSELKALESNDEVRGIILTGEGRSFIVGADINEMKTKDSESSIEFISNLHGLIDTVRNLKKPVIASINGYCYGAGLELAVACDLTIASNEATFGMQEVQIGIPSVIEAALLPFIIGLNKTRELLLTGEVIDSEIASDIGLVNHIVQHEELFEQTLKYTRKITQNPPHSVMLQKQLINRWLENAGLDQSIKNGIDSFGISFAYPETKKIMREALK